MKRYAFLTKILTLACACVIAASSTRSSGATTPADSGRLLIYRGAKFGYRLNLVLSLDDKEVASLAEGQTYDGNLPAGKHVIVAQVTPKSAGVTPGRQTVTIEPGHTYSYTALLSGKYLVLAKKK